jgi:hypothetical protein
MSACVGSMPVHSIVRQYLLHRPLQTTENTKDHGGPRRKAMLRFARSASTAGAANWAATPLPPETSVHLRGPSCSPWLQCGGKPAPVPSPPARWSCPDPCNRQGETHGAADLTSCRVACLGANVWVNRHVNRQDAKHHEACPRPGRNACVSFMDPGVLAVQALPQPL